MAKLLVSLLSLFFSLGAFSQSNFDPLNQDPGAGLRANELETEQEFFNEEPEVATKDEEEVEELSDEVEEFDDRKDGKDIAEEALEGEPVELDQEPLPQIKREKPKIKSQYKREKKYIRHPYAKKGLVRITKDKTYIYKTPTTTQDRAVTVKMGFYEPTNLMSDSGVDFTTIYEDSGSSPMILFDYEWEWFRGFGRASVKAGSGFYFTSGNARFADGEEAEEALTFIVFPNNVGLIYRFQYSDKQFFIPYAEGGGDIFTFAERRDDENNPGIGAALGATFLAHFSFGGQINMGSLSREAAINLDREYGINALHLIAEFRSYVSLSGEFDFSDNVINVGITTEF